LFLQTRDNQIFQEGRDVVTVCEWTDRIYQNTQPEHIITNVVSGRKMRVQKYNFPDTVVWNPWQEKARDIPDFGDDEFPNMICVESGHVSSPVILLPGTAFEASQILQVRHYPSTAYDALMWIEISTCSTSCIRNPRDIDPRRYAVTAENDQPWALHRRAHC
jgi:hypothetical protein